jgi:hypothetical protein
MSTNRVAPSVPATHASDDEILEITTNGARRSGRNVVDKKYGHSSSATVSQVKSHDLFSDHARGEDEVGDSGGGSDDEAADNSANHAQDLNGDGERQKLNELLDAKAYREIFATPAEASCHETARGFKSYGRVIFFAAAGRSCRASRRGGAT